MLPLISVLPVILGALGMKRLLPGSRKHRRQVRFIRETLAAYRTFDNRRVISLHDVPDGRQYNNNETIAFFGDTWDIFA